MFLNHSISLGFRPPPPPPPQGGYPPTQSPQRLPLNGSPMGTPINTAPPSATNTPPRDTQKDKLNTLFVGAIAAGVSDDWIETLLKVRKQDRKTTQSN